jgi:hypothetical protein
MTRKGKAGPFPANVPRRNKSGPPSKRTIGAVTRIAVARAVDTAGLRSRSQREYLAWFAEVMAGERCQCPDPQCTRAGTQVHHEPGGTGKDDRSIVWLSLECHDRRHRERGTRYERSALVGLPYWVEWTPGQYRAALRARAFDNFLRWLEAL